MNFHDITIWITKYTLTSGIVKKVVQSNNFREYPNGDVEVVSNGWRFNKGKTFFLSEDEAIKDAEKRRLNRLSSLRKQIAKLENLEIKIKES